MIDFGINFDKYTKTMNDLHVFKDMGMVTHVKGNLLRGYVPGASVGSICIIYSLNESHSFTAEVVGFEGREVLLMALGEMSGIGMGSRIVLSKSKATSFVGENLLGRVINGLAEPLDGKGDLFTYDEVPLYVDVVNPMQRPPIRESLSLGVRAIDGMLSVGKGQRVGIMAGSGVGKSMLLGMIARSTSADVNVIALIGERGREVREFIEDCLGEEGMKRSVVVAVTSDQSPLLRMRGAFLATAIAEYFSSQGKNVLMMMDSVTRFAMAQREIGLSTGEPPASKGYTPSVFSLLPKLLERAGTFEGKGSITGLYTVLVEGDDMDDPIGDTVRSIVDGHFVLSRELTQKGHYPAIDVLQSASRVMRNVVDKEHVQIAQFIRQVMATYQDAEDLINIGAYKEGANERIDQAVALYPSVLQFLQQDVEDGSDMEQAITHLKGLVGL